MTKNKVDFKGKSPKTEGKKKNKTVYLEAFPLRLNTRKELSFSSVLILHWNPKQCYKAK